MSDIAKRPLMERYLESTEIYDLLPTGVEGKPYSREWYDTLRRNFGQVGCTQLGFYAMPENFVLSVVIPVYNERATLEDIVGRVRRIPIKKEIILVDDCSSDGSRELLQALKDNDLGDDQNRILVLFHDRNRGKGAALRTGFTHLTGNAVIVQDADLEYDPTDYLRLLQPIVEMKADVVYGSRFLGNHPRRVLYFWHYVGNKLLTTLSNCFTNINVSDMETGYKVLTRRVVEDIAPTLRQDRFGFEPEITAKIARRGYRIYEMSISYFGRTYDEGKKITWRDGLKALWCIVRYGLELRHVDSNRNNLG